MSTVACAGCGMPRAAELVESSACPVCGHLGFPEPSPLPPPPPTEPVAVALPPNVEPKPERAGNAAFAGAVGFVLGALVGVGGLLAWQGRFMTTPFAESVARTEQGGDSRLQPTAVEVAPAPREVSLVVPKPATPTAERPAPTTTPPAVVPAEVPAIVKAAGKAVVIELSEPQGGYKLDVPMETGKHVVLKGKIGQLHLGPFDRGSTLDASNLEARRIRIEGKIIGGSEVKLNAPGGEVVILGVIEDGAKVGITGRVIDLQGGVGGAKTEVKAVVGRAGTLRVANIRDTATVEYTAGSGGWSEPHLGIGPVSGGATFRKAEPK